MMMSISNNLLNGASALSKLSLTTKAAVQSPKNNNFGAVLESDIFVKPSVHFGNDYAKRRNAALAQRQSQPNDAQIVAALESAQREAEVFDIVFRRWCSYLNLPVLEPVGDLPAFTQGDLMCLLAKPGHEELKNRTLGLTSTQAGPSFRFTKAFLLQEGFNEKDVETMFEEALDLSRQNLATTISGKWDSNGLDVLHRVTRGFELTELGRQLANRYAREKSTPQS